MNDFSELSGFIWGTADLIRDSFKRSKYQDVILPFTVARRIDSPYTFERLLDDPHARAENLNAYINGFSDNMRKVLEKFDFRNTIEKLEEAGLLFQVMERFGEVDLHPDKVSNHQTGYVFEDLIRRFNEALNENPGEHFTPREVVRLMVDLLLASDENALSKKGITRTVYDPCCGTGGMLTATQHRIHEINPDADVYLFGQEVNPDTFAICKSDLFMKSEDGRDAENILFGSTLSDDRFPGRHFDYLLANPPYGKDWKRDRNDVERAGKVQLIDASAPWEPMRKSLSDKRRYISDEQIREIKALYEACDEGDRAKIFETTEFGYRKGPRRTSAAAQLPRLARADRTAERRAHPPESRQSDARTSENETKSGEEREEVREEIRVLLRPLATGLYTDKEALPDDVMDATDKGRRDTRAVCGAIVSALGKPQRKH